MSEKHQAIEVIERIEKDLSALKSYVEATAPLAEQLKWMPINTAPTDGRPIWARGWDWGNVGTKRHYSWVYHANGEWWASGSEGAKMVYLTDWMPVSVPPELERGSWVDIEA